MVRVGRWIACPDIETQYAPDNYMASHSLLFTYDTYTQTGVMFTFQLERAIDGPGRDPAGTDMAPWYAGRDADRVLRPPLGVGGQQRLPSTPA